MKVAYTGRESLETCWHVLSGLGVEFVEWDAADLGISAGGSHIFSPAEIAACRHGIVNLHMAPLPHYRGRYSAGHALRNGETYFGATLHYVDAGIDTGPVIAERLFPIEDDTVESLREKARLTAIELFRSWAPRLMDGPVPSWRQDETKARYYDRASLVLL